MNSIKIIGISVDINIYSENEPYRYGYDYVNKYGQSYILGGKGNGDWEDKSYLDAEYNTYLFGNEIYTEVLIPNDTNLNDVYYQLKFDVYQGESINIENFGTLYFVGICEEPSYDWYTDKEYKEIYYVYTNSLSKLKNPTKITPFLGKTKTGYELHGYINSNYKISSGIKEKTIKAEDTDITLNMVYYGNNLDEKLKFGLTKAKKTNILNEKLKNGYKDLEEKYYDNLIIHIENLCIVSGTYQGNINLEFDVGTQYNGQKYSVFYNRDWIDSNYYKGTVKDGKVTITIDTSEIKRANDNIIKPGDINGDGKINTKDAREALLAYIGKTKLTEAQKILADVNRDGKVNTKDARQILLYYIGKIKKF